MIKYLVDGTEGMITASVLLGMLFAYVFREYKTRGRQILLAGTVLGFLMACVMAYLKNKTKLINTSTWNLRIFTVSMIVFLLFLITDLKFLRSKARVLQIVSPVFLSIWSFCLLFYTLPDVLAYPYTFVLGGNAIFTTGFLYRLIGLFLGILLCLIAGVSTGFVAGMLDEKGSGILLKLALLVANLQFAAKMLSILLARRVLTGHNLFQLVKFTSNHAQLFIFLILALAFIAPIIMLARSLHVQEPYENPAQKRKIKAKWRGVRRWSGTVIACFALAVFTLTSVKAYANRPVELSPTEECEVRGENVYVSFAQVEDGHLHRFAYTTPNGVAVRFIVIKKPNSSAYGIGLDACDICGETGYFERNGQIVCKLCDVVMNVNTIGFKGGCNPKVIDYTIENGYIIVPTDTLIEHESDFK